MKQSNMKRMISAITVAVVLVVVGMLVGLIFQFTHLSKLKAEAAELNRQVQELKDSNADAQNQIDFFNNARALEDMYHSQGYGKDGDIFFE
ncbi:MAG: septum formation initiator family protein [Christensenellaceae bacterium]|jgi:cell division protein FtsL|nr:septum formation initiator family protein [Christensenellaceae bacterium]